MQKNYFHHVEKIIFLYDKNSFLDDKNTSFDMMKNIFTTQRKIYLQNDGNIFTTQ